MSASYNKFNVTTTNFLKAVHNFSTDTVKVMLTNSAPVATNALLSDITEIATGHGYVAGGASITPVLSTSTATAKLSGSNVVWTASGGSIGPFRYIVLYDATPTSPLKPLVGWWDYGSNLTLSDPDTFTVVFDGTNGILQVT